MSDPALCARCKGARRLCGRPKCPILERIEANIKLLERIGKLGAQLYGLTPPSTLVGEYGYPKVNVILNIPPTAEIPADEYEVPEKWWGRKKLEDIIRLRSMLIGSKFRVGIKERDNKLLEAAREAAISIKPVDAEAIFKRPPRFRLSFDGIIAPLGPSGDVKRVYIVGNPVVPRRVDQLMEDEDVRASDAIVELYRSGISVYQIERLLSLGLLGRKRDRRLVPTRWSITATDSVLADKLLKKVREYEEINEIRIYSSEYIGNHYEIIMVPGAWSFEMIEIWLPRTIWVKAEKPYISVNYELHDGKWRKEGVDGGYHAMRMPVLAYLFKERRQARVIAIREVSPSYYAPVGVWQVRESVRAALARGYEKKESLREALYDISKRIKTPMNLILANSYLLRSMLTQEDLLKYMRH